MRVRGYASVAGETVVLLRGRTYEAKGSEEPVASSRSIAQATMISAVPQELAPPDKAEKYG